MKFVGTEKRNTFTGEDRKVYSVADGNATAGQTVFYVSYQSGRVDVYLNGVKLVPVNDFTYQSGTFGTFITLVSGISSTDYIELVGYFGNISGDALAVDNFIVGTNSTGSGGAYTGSTTVFPVVSSQGSKVNVFLNGILLDQNSSDFSIDIVAGTITLASAATNGDSIEVHVIGTVQVLADFIGTDGVTAGYKGAVPAPATSDVNKYLKSDGNWATLDIEDILSFSTTLAYTLDNPNTYGTRSNDRFGISISIDGSYVIVGTPYETDSTNTYSSSGIAYVYDLTSNTPTTPIHVLDNPNTSGTPTNDGFGISVSKSGNYIVVGAGGSDGGTSGHAYVYDLTSGTPTTPIHTLTNPNLYGTATADAFGQKVVVKGNYVVVGAIGDNSFQGTIYIYDLSSATPTTPIHSITNPNLGYDGSGNVDYFSMAFDISGDILVVGAPYEDETSDDDDNGIAYVFDLASANPTTPIYTITNPNYYLDSTPDYGDRFGSAIAIDGNIILIGSPSDEIDSTTDNPGVVHVFDLSSSDPTTPTTTLLNPTPSNQERFGSTVAIKGNYAVIGTTNSSAVYNAGEVYVFNITSGSLVKTLTNPNSQTNDSSDIFGFDVAISDDYVIASAPYEDYDVSTFDSGKVYVYSIGSGNYIQPNYIENYVGPANSTTAGVAGLVPASASSDYNTNKYLKVDGTWATVPDESFINSIIFG